MCPLSHNKRKHGSNQQPSQPNCLRPTDCCVLPRLPLSQDLFNENRLSQVVRCLFSLSELVRTTMPSFHGPYLAAPEKPQVDPAVLHLVDLAKGNVVPAPGWGGPVTPGAVSTASTGGANSAVGAAGPSMLSLPKNHHASTGSGCLSPAAHEAGKLTYGIYEGGGVATVKPLATSPIVGRSGGQQLQGRRCGGGGGEEGEAGETDSAAAETVAEALQEQLQAADDEQQQNNRAVAAAGGVGNAVAAIEYAESALPAVNTPRATPLPTPRGTPRGASAAREPMTPGNWTRAMSISTPTRGPAGGDAAADGGGGKKKGFGPGSLEEQAKRRREATARTDAEMEVALWIEGVTGETFPGKFWSSLKDGGEKIGAYSSSTYNMAFEYTRTYKYNVHIRGACFSAVGCGVGVQLQLVGG